MKLNSNYIEIKFFDFEESHEELTKILKLEPTNIWIKGKEHLVGSLNGKTEKNRNRNYWGYESKIDSNDWIGDLTEKFINDVVLPRSNDIKELTKKCHGEFSIVQYVYDSINPGFYFDKRQIKILSDCCLELNIDVYVLTRDEVESNSQ